jgi:hypothetical protein
VVTRLIAAQDLVVAADYGQIYIESSATDDDPWEEDDKYMGALNDATESGRFVGVRPGLIDLKTPGQWNFETPMRLETWSAEPADDQVDWDHEVDVDFDVPGGWISFAPSGLGSSSAQRAEIPPGNYRVRVSGRGFTALGGAGAEGDDNYRLRLWPRERPADPVLRKRWPGWDGYH